MSPLNPPRSVADKGEEFKCLAQLDQQVALRSRKGELGALGQNDRSYTMMKLKESRSNEETSEKANGLAEV